MAHFLAATACLAPCFQQQCSLAHWHSVQCRELQRLGASPLKRIFTAGGGAASTKWTEIRQARLPVPVIASPQAESAYGAAMLAREGWLRSRGEVGPLQTLGLV